MNCEHDLQGLLKVAINSLRGGTMLRNAFEHMGSGIGESDPSWVMLKAFNAPGLALAAASETVPPSSH